jgi:hypothetical protein
VLANIVPAIEQHVNWITDCIEYLRANDQGQIEAREDAR